MPCALGLTSTRGRPASLSQGSGCLPAELTAAEASLCHRVGVKQPCTCELCRQAGCYCITNSIEGGRLPMDPGNQSPLNPCITFDESGDY